MEDIKRIGSTDPAALLYDAMGAFEEGDPKSDENIRFLSGKPADYLFALFALSLSLLL